MDAAYAGSYRMLWERHWWWRSRENYVRSWLDQLADSRPIDRILDIGCGDGLFFEVLSRYGAVEGLEPDSNLVQDPRWRSRIRVGTLDAGFETLDRFDLALMLDVLEHIEDDTTALVRLRKALRPGGHLLLTVPALPWLWSRHDEVNQHHRRYTRRGLTEVLRAAGFEVETVRPFFAWTIGPMLIRKLLAPARAGGQEYRVGIPPTVVNRWLTRISSAEHAVTRRVRVPLGSSLFALARVAGPAAN